MSNLLIEQKNRSLVLNILKAATFLLFAGRAWQHLFWDAPFRELLWDQAIMESIVLSLRGGTWEEYVTSENTDNFIGTLVFGFGIFYSIMAMLTLFVSERFNKISWLYILASVSLAFLAFLYCKEKFYHVGQFLEYAIQFLLPVIFIYTIRSKIKLPNLLLILKISIALTFSAHGLYAIGFYPQPGVFVDMLIHIFHVTEAHAKTTLIIVGLLDFVISIGIFIPRLSRYSLIYAALWGGLTALARIWANFYWSFPLDSLHQHLYETLYRLPHMLVPLAAYFITYPWFGRSRK
jgi:hypothetical protein